MKGIWNFEQRSSQENVGLPKLGSDNFETEPLKKRNFLYIPIKNNDNNNENKEYKQ